MRLALRHINAILSHAASSDVEVCGVLIGHHNPEVTIEMVVAARNVHSQPDHHFLLDAASLLAADALASKTGQTIVGFYHSHPNGTALPSAYDRRDAWANTVALIVAARLNRPCYLCAWSFRDGRVIPEPIGLTTGHQSSP